MMKVTFQIGEADSDSYKVTAMVPWESGSKLSLLDLNLSRDELSSLRGEIDQALDKREGSLFEQMSEFIRSIAEYDRYITYRELPDASEEEQGLHAYKFDAEVLRQIEIKAGELHLQLQSEV